MEFGGMDNWRAKEVARLLSLVESERRYFQEMLASLPAAVAVVAADHSIVLANRAFRRLFGPRKGGAAHRFLEELLPAPGLEEALEKALGEGQPAALDYREAPTRRGMRHLLLSLQPYDDWDDSGEAQAILVVEDLTGAATLLRQEREDAARATADAFDSLPGIAWELDPRTMTFVSVSEAAARRMGLAFEHWRAGGAFWSERVHAPDLANLRALYQAALSGANLQSCEYRAKSAAGEAIWVRDLLRPIHSETGEVTRVVGLTIDDTAARRTAAVSEQTAKAKAIERLSARVAHEGNNLLTILGGYGEELLHALPPDSPLRANAQEILRAGDRVSKLLSQLGPISTRPPVQIQPVMVGPFLARIREALAGAAPATVEVRLDAVPEGAAIRTDPQIVERLLRELVDRAVERMPNGGAITLSAREEGIGHASAAGGGPLRAGKRVSIEVRDNGPAIPPVTLAGIFEPLESGEAGLTALYLSAMDCGGELRVTSEHNSGSVFRLSFPAAEAGGETPGAAAAEVVLVAEDEAGIRTLIRKTLRRNGFQVLEAGSGEEALRLASEHEGPIHLLLTDVALAATNGVELARAIGAQREGIKVLFISGYTGPTGIDTAGFPAGAAFLQKPFTLAGLLGKVQELLGRRSSTGASV